MATSQILRRPIVYLDLGSSNAQCRVTVTGRGRKAWGIYTLQVNSQVNLIHRSRSLGVVVAGQRIVDVIAARWRNLRLIGDLSRLGTHASEPSHQWWSELESATNLIT